MADNIVYNTAPPVASDFQVKQNSSGSWDVINTNTGIYEGNYNTKVAADTYTNQKVAGVSEKASQAAAVAADTGQPSDSNTTATNTTSANTPALNPITKEVTTPQPNNNTTAPATDSDGTPGTVTKNNSQAPLTAPTQVSLSSPETPQGVQINSQADVGKLEPTTLAPVSDAVARTPAEIAASEQKPVDPTTLEGYGVNEVGATKAAAEGSPNRSIANSNTTKVQVTGPQKTSIGRDWRVRLSLASEATYLYKDNTIDSSNILFPLSKTDGVVFPYLPQINVSYRANYNPVEITHTNYKNYFYSNSSVDDISIIAEFTAQDNTEAQYMLAVIHFFKSVTKMFYGQDTNPRGGTPPPLCYLTGMGEYQFNNHPLVITNFAYNLPNDVDYIRTETNDAFSSGGIGAAPNVAVGKPDAKNSRFTSLLSKLRLSSAKLNKNATPSAPNFSSITVPGSRITYVPTKLQIQLSALPIVTRKDISNNFKLTGKNSYSSGKLTKQNGIW